MVSLSHGPETKEARVSGENRMRWFYQRNKWGLGNFIMATPMLSIERKRSNTPIPVYFDNDSIASLYRDSSFIRILKNKPRNKPFAATCTPKLNKKESDYQAFCRIYLDSSMTESPFVDNCQDDLKLERKDGKKYVAVFHGCTGTKYKKHKDVGKSVRQDIVDALISHDITPVILGNKADIDNYWSHNDISNSLCVDYLGKLSLRHSVSIAYQCDSFISNDTGLYHVCSALGKRGLVLWKNTDIDKNRCPSSRVDHIKKNYTRHILEFISNEDSI